MSARHIQSISKWLGIVIVSALAAGMSIATAAEAEPTEPSAEVANKPPKDTSTNDEPTDKKVDTAAAKKPKKNSDIFLPTERISEDYSVAFPADI